MQLRVDLYVDVWMQFLGLFKCGNEGIVSTMKIIDGLHSIFGCRSL
ncbi:unnamed protein product, partial [Rotaria socialis]